MRDTELQFTLDIYFDKHFAAICFDSGSSRPGLDIFIKFTWRCNLPYHEDILTRDVIFHIMVMNDRDVKTLLSRISCEYFTPIL